MKTFTVKRIRVIEEKITIKAPTKAQAIESAEYAEDRYWSNGEEISKKITQ